MKQEITINDIDELIAHLGVSAKTQKALLLKVIHQHFHKEEDISKVKSIKSNDIVLAIWPFKEGVTEKEKKAHLKAKKKSLSSLKSQLNHTCRDLYWAGKNPLRIGIGRFNTFHVLSETKYEEVQRLNSQIMFLENVVADLAPEKAVQLKDKSMRSVIERIQKTVAKRKEQGISFDTASDLPVAEEVQLIDVESEKKLKEQQIANAKLIIDANVQTGRLAEKLDKLTAEAEQIYDDIREGRISEKEGENLLEKNYQEWINISKVAKKLIDTLGTIDDQDLVLVKTIERIKKAIKRFIKDPKELEIAQVDGMLKKGIDALKDFQKLDKQSIDDGVAFDDREALEKEFLALKAQAKDVLAQLKPLNTKIKPLLKQKKTLDGLDEKQNNELIQLQEELIGLQESGKVILSGLKKIRDKIQGAMKEAAAFIISALERFLDIEKDKKEVLVILKKEKKTIEALREEGKQLDEFAEKAKEKIVDIEDQELATADAEYKKIEKEISDKKHSLKEAKQRLKELEEEKDAVEYEQAEAKRILEEKQKAGKPLTEQEIEHSKVLNAIKAQTQRLILQIEKLNEEATSVYQDIESGKMSESEGEKTLQDISDKRAELLKKFKSLGIDLEGLEDEDPVLADALKKIKASLKDLVKEGKTLDDKTLENVVKKGIEALKEFEEGDKKDLRDDVDFEDREAVEKEFLTLKKEAKNILNEFKTLNAKITPLLKKKNSVGGLAENEVGDLETYQQDLISIQQTGETILERLRNIKDKSEGAICEAATLIVSALEKFFKAEEAQKEMVKEVKKQDQALADLKESQQALNSFAGKMWDRTVNSTAGELLKNENPTFVDKLQQTKTSSHRLALQMDMLMTESAAALTEGGNKDEIEKNIQEIKADSEELSQSLDRALNKGKKVVRVVDDLSKGNMTEVAEDDHKETLIDSILLLSAESKQLAAKLKELDDEHEKLQNDIKTKQMNIVDAQMQLQELEKKRTNLMKQAAEMQKKVDSMEKELEEDTDPKLAEATSLIKQSLQTLLDEEGLSADALAQATKRGIEAIKDFNKAEDKFAESGKEEGKPGKLSDEERETLMNVFAPLKESAKEIISDFRRMDKRMKVLENKGDITEEEKKEYAQMHVKWRDTELAGKKLIQSMGEVLSKSDGALRESANLVLSSMTRYIRDVSMVSAAQVGEQLNDGKVIVLNLEQGSNDLDGIAAGLKKEREAKRLAAKKEKEASEKYFKSVFSKEADAQKEFNEAEKKLDETGDEEKELKAQFLEIKDAAKQLISGFRGVDKKLAAMHAKQKDTGNLSQEEQTELEAAKKDRLELEERGKQVIAELENLALKTEGALKDSAKLVVSSLKKFVTDIKEVFVDQISKLHVKEKVALPEGFEIEDLDAAGLEETTQSLADLIKRLKEGEGFLEALGKKYFPYEEELSKEDQDELDKLEERQRALKNKVQFLSDHINELVDSMKEAGELDESVDAEGGVSLLKDSIAAMQRGDTKASLEKIAGAINQFESLEDRLNFLSQSHIGKQDRVDAENASINIIKGKEGIAEELIEVGGEFFMDRYPITIAQYKSFVVETGYKTEAELNEFGWVYQKQGWLDTSQMHQRSLTLLNSSSLAKVHHASWSSPDGGGSTALDLFSAIDYPAVHLTYNDAKSYAEWAWKRLPTEEEWKFAAGLAKGEKYPWGNEAVTDRCNFKESNFKNMSPVNFFKPNVYGVYDMIGNIWEWCETDSEDEKVVLGGCWNMGLEELANVPKMILSPNISNNTIGFRCVRDIPK